MLTRTQRSTLVFSKPFRMNGAPQSVPAGTLLQALSVEPGDLARAHVADGA